MIGQRRRNNSLGVGHDAFLDIVANLVGVIIILIAVFGGTSTAMIQQIETQVLTQTSSGSPAAATAEQLDNLKQLAARTINAHADSDQLEHQIAALDTEIAVRRRQRNLLLDLRAEAIAAWEQKQAQLDQTKVAEAKRQTELARAQQQLTELLGEQERLRNLPQDVVALQHLPTPMAKKVYEDRVMLRLRANHVSVVPADALIQTISEQVKASARSGRPSATDVIGPIRGYTARYSLVMDQRVAFLHGAVFQPIVEPIGQPIDEVLRGASEIDSELAGRDPARTSVLVWVYPDSYRALRQLKEYLYSKGYATAVRPRETHEPIGISAAGTDSHAQ